MNDLGERAATAELGHLSVVFITGYSFENDEAIDGTVGMVTQIVAIN